VSGRTRRGKKGERDARLEDLGVADDEESLYVRRSPRLSALPEEEKRERGGKEEQAYVLSTTDDDAVDTLDLLEAELGEGCTPWQSSSVAVGRRESTSERRDEVKWVLDDDASREGVKRVGRKWELTLAGLGLAAGDGGTGGFDFRHDGRERRRWVGRSWRQVRVS
jgi:hypothetical protein